MLKSLHIKDYALIDSISVSFESGLNIITGETGAGKSILIDAMSLLLGERASSEVIRKGASKSIVEGIFDISSNQKVAHLFSENDIEITEELIIRRELSLKGSNRCFINDSPVPLNLIKEFGNMLVDLHGQHEHQSLLRTDTHIDFLDEFAQLDSLIETYREQLQNLNRIKNELKELKEKESILKEKKELYSFQIKEIDAVSPLENEDQLINDELIILENSEKLLELSSSVYDSIYDDDNSVYDSLSKIKSNIQTLFSIDKSFADIVNEAETALTLINDITAFVRDYRSRVELDPKRLDDFRERLASINLLKKKFGGQISTVLEYRKKIGEEVLLAETFEETIKSLYEELKNQRIKCGQTARQLSGQRESFASIISRDVLSELTALGIPDAKFEVRIKQTKADNGNEHFILIDKTPFQYDNYGVDEVEFFISTNAGEDMKPLSKVASGGEVSRVMLALKSSLAKNDKLPLLIFDEIDTGVSGRIAQKVGQALKALSVYHQIIAITHLPQIAGFADFHFSVEKKSFDERVTSTIRKLSVDERISEVAKLMSGEEVSEASIKSARELMGL